MEKYQVTIGFIPENNTSSLILCGDPEVSGTREVTFIVSDDPSTIEIVEASKTFDVLNSELYTPDSNLWRLVAENIASALEVPPSALTGPMLCSLWSIFMEEEPAIELDVQEVAGEDDGGEFSNSDGIYAGCFFVHYVLNEDGDYYGERVLVITN